MRPQFENMCVRGQFASSLIFLKHSADFCELAKLLGQYSIHLGQLHGPLHKDDTLDKSRSVIHVDYIDNNHRCHVKPHEHLWHAQTVYDRRGPGSKRQIAVHRFFCMVAEQLLDLVAVVLVSLELLVPLLAAIGLLLTASVGCIRHQRERRLRQCKVDKWARLVMKINRIRRLQRIFACVGLHLRENISKGIKEKLK